VLLVDITILNCPRPQTILCNLEKLINAFCNSNHTQLLLETVTNKRSIGLLDFFRTPPKYLY